MSPGTTGEDPLPPGAQLLLLDASSGPAGRLLPVLQQRGLGRRGQVTGTGHGGRAQEAWELWPADGVLGCGVE